MSEVELKSIRPTLTNQTPVESNNTATMAASNPAYVEDDNELRKKKVSKTDGSKEDVKEYADEDFDSSDDDDDDFEPGGAFAGKVAVLQTGLRKFYECHEKVVWTTVYIVLVILYFAYFSYAMYYKFHKDDEGSMRLLIVTILVVIFIVYKLIYRAHCSESTINIPLFSSTEDSKRMKKIRFAIHMCLAAAAVITAIVILVVEVALKNPRNLVSLSGMAFFVLSFYIFSYNPAKVQWRPVFWGIMIQFYFALIILKSTAGADAFSWLGDRIKEFLLYTDSGSAFVFGPAPLDMHVFAFQVLPIVIFFSSCVSVLYHWGVMQFIIRTIARFLAWCLGTSPAESLNAAGNIFIGQSEAPLMIRPFLKVMSRSELHAILTGGFATIAGGVMGTYIAMGIPANHLLSASVMSAPAALAMSKLFYPETRKSRASADLVYKMKKGSEHNFIEAASNGASLAGKLVANIAVNLIAFIAILAFVNATLTWFGHRVGLTDPPLTFQLICSYVFWPLAYMMGTDFHDCKDIASLIGTKTFVNEFVAYIDLQQFVKNREALNNYLINATGNFTTGVLIYSGNDVYIQDLDQHLELISDRSLVIATYALCGFANLGSMGIMLGALGSLAPNQKGRLAKIVLRAMIAGNVACFMTASIAGVLYEGI